ncbi:MAG: anti-sigma factor family protein [Armatimonadota bacterium]
MLCSQVRELLPDYSVEILDGRAHQQVASHLELCADCRAELTAMDSVMAMVEELGVRQPPPGLFNAVRNRIESGEVTRERPAWWAWIYSRPARGLAMGMAAAALALGLLVPVGPSDIPPLSIHEGAGRGSMTSSALAQSIRQHAMSAGEGPVTDRVAYEAMAQLASQDEAPKPNATETR